MAAPAVRHTGFPLLSTSSTALERAVSRVDAERRDAIPWHLVAEFFDPETCPADLLGWLATVFSVDLWIEGWSETRQRQVIARAIELHRKKGTLAGMEAFAALVDATVIEARTPPDIFFLDEEDGKARANWLASLPAVEVRHWRRTGQREQAGALADIIQAGEEPAEGAGTVALEMILDDDEPDTSLPAFFCLDGPEPDLAGMDAVLIEDGVETKLGIESGAEAGDRRAVVADVERLYFPAAADPFLFLGLDDARADTDPTFLGDDSPAAGRHAAYLQDDERRYVARIRRGLGRVAADPGPTVRGRDVVDVDPERIYPSAPAPETWFLDEVPWDPTVLGYLADELTIWTAFIDRWRLVDPDKPGQAGPAFSFLGHDRLGMPAYEAEITVAMPEPSNPLAWFLGDVPGDPEVLGFLLEEKAEGLYRLCDALNTARSKRDRVLVGVARTGARTLREARTLAELFS